jgi:hypothetical protein
MPKEAYILWLLSLINDEDRKKVLEFVRSEVCVRRKAGKD